MKMLLAGSQSNAPKWQFIEIIVMSASSMRSTRLIEIIWKNWDKRIREWPLVLNRHTCKSSGVKWKCCPSLSLYNLFLFILQFCCCVFRPMCFHRPHFLSPSLSLFVSLPSPLPSKSFGTMYEELIVGPGGGAGQNSCCPAGGVLRFLSGWNIYTHKRQPKQTQTHTHRYKTIQTKSEWAERRWNANKTNRKWGAVQLHPLYSSHRGPQRYGAWRLSS